MIFYSPKSHDPKTVIATANLSRNITFQNGTSNDIIVSSISALGIPSLATTAPLLSWFKAFVSDSDVATCAAVMNAQSTIVSTFPFEKMWLNTTAPYWITRLVEDGSVVYNTDYSLSINVGKLFTKNAANVTNSGNSNNGMVVSNVNGTLKTFGLCIGQTYSAPDTNGMYQYFLFSIGNKNDSTADIRINNPTVQIGDIIDFSDTTLTIKLPHSVGG